MSHLETVYTTAHSQGKIVLPKSESCGLRPYYSGVLPSSGNGLLESSKRDMFFLSRLPGWQQLTSLVGNR